MDEGNDAGWLYSNFEERKCHPVVPLLNTPAVERGEHKPPSCSMASGDSLDRTQSGEPPSGGARPASASPPHGGKADRLHSLIPRETLRWRKLYRGRAAVGREFGRLKNEWALLPLRVRGLERVKLHADLTIFAKLSCALARARAVPIAA
jgi:hypothetical protein